MTPEQYFGELLKDWQQRLMQWQREDPASWIASELKQVLLLSRDWQQGERDYKTIFALANRLESAWTQRINDRHQRNNDALFYELSYIYRGGIDRDTSKRETLLQARLPEDMHDQARQLFDKWDKD